MDENERGESDESDFDMVAKILRKLGRNAGPRSGNYFSIPQSSGESFN